MQVPSGSSATLRVVADNPGAWFFHCHIEWHLEVGLAVQLIAAPALIQQGGLEQGRVPQGMYANCERLGKGVSGNAAGHASASDLGGLVLGPYPQVLGWHPRGIGAMAGWVFFSPFLPLRSGVDYFVLFRRRCVLTALLGMATVVWYSLGGHISEAEAEDEVRAALAAKEKRGRFYGLGRVFRR